MAASHGYQQHFRADHPLRPRSGNSVGDHRVVLFDEIGPGPHRCTWCGCPVSWWREPGVELLCVDHLNDTRDDNRGENLVPACRVCNGHRRINPKLIERRREAQRLLT